MTIKEVLYVIGLGLLLGLGILGVKFIKNWYDTRAKLETTTAIGTTSSGMTADGVKADEDRSKVDYALSEGRGQFNRDYQGAKRDEPQVANYAATPVPARVRDALRKRRLARERLGCASSECEPGSQAPDPAQR